MKKIKLKNMVEVIGKTSFMMLLLLIGMNSLINIHLFLTPIGDFSAFLWFLFISIGSVYAGWKI